MTRDRRASTLIEVLVVMAVVGIVFGLLLPAIQAARGAALRVRCQNNLRQIGLALHQYHDVADRFPPGTSYRADRGAYTWMTWCVRILPYLEQDAIWQQAVAAYASDRSFSTPPHDAPRATLLSVFTCPVDTQAGTTAFVYDRYNVSFTTYLGVHGFDQSKQDGVLYRDSRTNLIHITDGTSQTLMVGERPPSADFEFGWFYAGVGHDGRGSSDATLGARDRQAYYPPPVPRGPFHFQAGNPTDLASAFHFWSMHSGGAHFAFADGSVRFLRYSADDILPALATRAGGEVADLP